MDPGTQALLGGAVTQSFFGKKLGRKAFWWGAFAAALPDLDILLGNPKDPTHTWIYHRGFTHALWFEIVFGMVLGFLVWKFYNWHWGSPKKPLKTWMALFILALLSHPLLDVLTPYGTQLFAPFSRARFAINAMPIIDPVYTLILFLGLFLAAFFRKNPNKKVFITSIALILSTFYLFFAFFLNEKAKSVAKHQLQSEGVQNYQIKSYPTIFQIFLRRVVVQTPDEIRIAFITLWDPRYSKRKIPWKSFRPPKHLGIDQIKQTKMGTVFTWFAMEQIFGKIFRENQKLRVELHDLRYGIDGPPDQSLWGIYSYFDPKKQKIGDVKKFYIPREKSFREEVIKLLASTFILPNEET